MLLFLMDSITRLARAYNLVIPPSGRTLSGGIDPAAFHRPKRFFGAARNLEEGGSLTILATALIEQVHEWMKSFMRNLKEQVTIELHLDRHLAERRIFPALDIRRSGTRKEELLIPEDQLEKLWAIRKTFSDSHDFAERFLKKLRQTKTNEEFFEKLNDEMKAHRNGKGLL